MRSALAVVILTLLLPAACASQAPVVTVATAPQFPASGCDPLEQLYTHYHVHLAIFIRGEPRPVPAFIGLRSGCISWLHTHDSSGIVHVEAPADQRDTIFTLGSFFQVWQQPLTSDRIGLDRTRPGEHVFAFINGYSYQADVRQLPLYTHDLVTLELDKSPLPPPSFTWPEGK